MSDPLFETLRRFAATMTSTFDVHEMLYELCQGVVATLDIAGAGVSVIRDDRLEFVAATDQRVIEMEEVQEEHQAGPCVEAFNSGEIVIVPIISEIDTWPAYRAVARSVGFVSVIGFPLSHNGHRIGSLNVYDTRDREFDHAELEAAGALVDVATAYLVRANELAEAHKLTKQLEAALDSRIVIEQAKGMLSRDHSISVDDAFQLLRAHSQRENMPLREVARAVVHLDLTLST